MTRLDFIRTWEPRKSEFWDDAGSFWSMPPSIQHFISASEELSPGRIHTDQNANSNPKRVSVGTVDRTHGTLPSLVCN